MKHAACIVALVIAACQGPPEVAYVDGSTVHDAGVDAVVTPDAGPARSRAPGYRLLRHACGAWAYDLDDPTSYDTPEELAIAMADARCQWSLRCSDTSSSACDPIRVQSYVELQQPVDLSLARACLQALTVAACDPDARYAAELFCVGLDRGGAPQGRACSANRFCRSQNCVGATESCGGTCGPPPECPSDCVGTCTTLGECIVETFLALGDACSPEGSFGVGPACGAHLVCPDTGMCVPRPRAGEPCLLIGSFFPQRFCDEGLACDGTNCVVPITVDDGQACSPLALCRDGSECFESVCTHTPLRGEACRVDRHCATGSICNADHVCAAMVGPGCACDDGSGCPFAFRCLEGTCQRVGAGVPVACTDAVLDCDGTPCVDGHCFLRLLTRSCSLENACDEGHCRPHGIGVCTPTVASGGACSGDPYGCGSGEMCVDFTTFCALPDDQQNPCVPGYP